MLVDISITNPSTIPDDDIRALVSAVMCKAIMDGKHIPDKINIVLVRQAMRRIILGNRVMRSGELAANSENPNQNLIKVMFKGRENYLVFQSIFHELTHLLRIVNKTNNVDPFIEEYENTEEMELARPAVECILSVLMLDRSGELRSMGYDAKSSTDAGTGELVRQGNPGRTDGLPLPSPALEGG